MIVFIILSQKFSSRPKDWQWYESLLLTSANNLVVGLAFYFFHFVLFYKFAYGLSFHSDAESKEINKFLGLATTGRVFREKDISLLGLKRFQKFDWAFYKCLRDFKIFWNISRICTTWHKQPMAIAAPEGKVWIYQPRALSSPLVLSFDPSIALKMLLKTISPVCSCKLFNHILVFHQKNYFLQTFITYFYLYFIVSFSCVLVWLVFLLIFIIDNSSYNFFHCLFFFLNSFL